MDPPIPLEMVIQEGPTPMHQDLDSNVIRGVDAMDPLGEVELLEEDSKQGPRLSKADSSTKLPDLEGTLIHPDLDSECVVANEVKVETPDINKLLKTDLMEMTTGEEIIREANKIFSSNDSHGSAPKVSMAFKVVKRAKTKEVLDQGEGKKKKRKKKKKHKEKKVKVIITSKKALAAAMKAAENGQDPMEVMSRLNNASNTFPASPPSKSKKKEPTSKSVPLSLQPADSVIDKIGQSIKTIPKDLVQDDPNDPDYELYDDLYCGDDPEYDNEDPTDFVKTEPVLDDLFDDNDDIKQEDIDWDDDELPMKAKRGRRLGSKIRRDHGSLEMTSSHSVVNSVDQAKGFWSLNLDDYVVASVDKNGDVIEKAVGQVKNEAEGEQSEETSSSRNDADMAKIYGCAYCDYTGRKQNWMIHIKSRHKDKTIFFCSRNRVCSMPFNTRELLDKHTEEAHKVQHECPTCHKVYRYPSQLSKHMESHLDLDSEEKKKHICPYCGKKFSTRSGYRSHEAHYHTKDLKHKCDWDGCDKAFFSLNDLTIHKRSHTGELPFVCSYCGTGFAAKCRLVQHEKVIHLRIGKQKVECEICHKMIRQKHMSFHLKTHKGLTTAWCSVCGKGFPTAGGKRRHEKIHFNIKNYACKFCGKAFVQKANMEAHERIHTGVKPYACKYCGDCFVQGTRRNQHQNACRLKPIATTQGTSSTTVPDPAALPPSIGPAPAVLSVPGIGLPMQ